MENDFRLKIILLAVQVDVAGGNNDRVRILHEVPAKLSLLVFVLVLVDDAENQVLLHVVQVNEAEKEQLKVVAKTQSKKLCLALFNLRAIILVVLYMSCYSYLCEGHHYDHAKR